MTAVLRLSIRAYAALLPLYPPDLLRDFGEDMQQAFAEDLQHASRSFGLGGILGVWSCSLRELVRIALPARFGEPLVAVPCIAFALCEAMMVAEFLLIRADPAMAAHPELPLELLPMIAVFPGLASVLIAFVALLASNSGVPARLNLVSR
jgi:hypothetical protein